MLIGHPEYIGQEGMVGAAARKKYHDKQLDADINKWLSQYTVKEAAALLDECGIPNAIVQTAEEGFNDPQVAAREMLICPRETVLDDIPVIGNPIKMSETPAEYRRGACAAGYDSKEILEELLERDEAQIAQLKEHKII